MRIQRIHHSVWMMSAGFLILVIAGCMNSLSETTASTETPKTTSPTMSTVNPAVSSLPTEPELPADKNVLYQEDFTNPASGWPEEKLDNYFIGYHEPEYFHVQLLSSNFKHPVYAPNKKIYKDITVQLKVLAEVAWEGNFRYGLIFRRSGDLYYAFVISPSTKNWYVLKSTSDALQTLTEGTDESIQGVGSEDTLRVDAKRDTFVFHINDKQVGQISDPDYYAEGEVGLYAQTTDSPAAHVHFNGLIIRNYEAIQTNALYRDDFTNPASGWPREKLDNYYIGYHEPEYYQIQFLSSNFKYPVYVPNKKSYKDITIQLKALTEIVWPGDFRYGLIFRRSGDLYYAFIISPRTKKWSVLKSTVDALQPLQEGLEEGIKGVSVRSLDTLRVDAKGDTFFFHINDKQVGQISDPDYYAEGEVGLFVRTMDSKAAHIHFDELAIWDFQAPLSDTSSPPGNENCNNGEDEDEDNLIDTADSDCANASAPIDHHKGANGPVNATNCSRCHTLPWAISPSNSSGGSGSSGSSNDDGWTHPVGCGPCHASTGDPPPSSSDDPTDPNNPLVTPTMQKPNPHPPPGLSCVLCHVNGTPTTSSPGTSIPTVSTATAHILTDTPVTPAREKPNPHPPPGILCTDCHPGGPPTLTPFVPTTEAPPPTTEAPPSTTEIPPATTPPYP